MVLVLLLQRLDTSVSSPLVVRLIRVRVTVCSHCNAQHRLAGKLGPPHTATHVSAVPIATGHGHATKVWYRSHYGLLWRCGWLWCMQFAVQAPNMVSTSEIFMMIM